MLDLYFGEMSRWTDGLILTTVMSTLSVYNVVGTSVHLVLGMSLGRGGKTSCSALLRSRCVPR